MSYTNAPKDLPVMIPLCTMDSEFGRLTPAGMWASCAAMSLCTRITHDSSNKLSNMGGRINSGARSTKVIVSASEMKRQNYCSSDAYGIV